MKTIPVDDLPDELAELVARFADYVRLNRKIIEEKGRAVKKTLPQFLEIELGVSEPLTRKEIYEDV